VDAVSTEKLQWCCGRMVPLDAGNRELGSLFAALAQVLVLDAGTAKEFDAVPKLMSRSNSLFRAMVVDAGLADEVSAE
jgi:hypothetical protein